MNRKIRKIPVLAAIVCIMSSCGNTHETYTVTEQTFNEAVYASGELFPGEYHIIKSSATERILEILVKEGDRVGKGAVLVVLGTPADNDRLSVLENQVVLAKENSRDDSAILTELQQKIALAKAYISIFIICPLNRLVSYPLFCTSLN